MARIALVGCQRPHTIHRAVALAALTCQVLAACGTSEPKRQPSAGGPPATSGSPSVAVATKEGPHAAAPPSTAAAPPAAQALPILDDHGLVGLTPAQMASPATLQAAFPEAKVVTGSRRYCPRGTSQTSPTECTAQDGAAGAGPVRAYQVLTVQGAVPRAADRRGEAAGSYLLQVIVDGDRPVNISYDIGRLGPADVVAMPTTLAAAQRWRAQPSCTWEQYPEASAHLLCRYRDSKLRVVTQGPTPRVDEDSEAASVEWDLEPAELPTWIASHGSDKVTSVEWGDELGPQAY